MSKKFLLPIIFLLSLSLAILLSCNAVYPNYSDFKPGKESGEGGFDFPSNAYSADVTLDGYLTDEAWLSEGVVSLGTWDSTDVESGVYGAIVADSANYENSKRAVGKMFRGTVGLHFGFEVKDTDVCYQQLADGDPAIWTDNVLINLCTAIDGSSIPMSDDYYFIVTAFGNNCFRRGANAAGMWGAWSGVIDYESAIHYAEDGETVIGFGVEMIIPYEQIGITANSPIGVTFRSCDRISESKSMVEREWYFNGSAHHFNTPNGYAIWGEDNQLYDYYAYQMPEVTVKGSVIDYITGEALANVDLDNGVISDDNGNFIIENVNANDDLVLTAQSDLLLGTQTYTLSRDQMRQANGGTVTVTPSFLTVKNKITQTVKGNITSIGDLTGVTVKMGDQVATLDERGNYSLECVFTSPVMKLSVVCANGVASYDTDIPVNEAVKGKVVCNVELPVMTKLSEKFGNSKDAETLLGWNSTGLFVRIEGETPTNGYGVAYSVNGENGKVVLYHDFGTMCITDFQNLIWDYALPSAHGVEALKYVSTEGKNVYQFVLPYELMGIESAQDIFITPFEYTLQGPFSWYKDENGTVYQFGNNDMITGYPTLTANAQFNVRIPETVLKSYTTEPFGKSNATVTFEQIESVKNGIKVTVNHEEASALWGYGVMFGDLKGNAITQLYALGFGTIDHKIYGDWDWQGNYKPAADLGVEATEENGVLTLFYSYETLANYGLEITAESKEIKLQLFEYVTDTSGNLYGCYNCMNVNGEPFAFDQGLEKFVSWKLVEEETPENPNDPVLPESYTTYESEVFGKSNAVSKFEVVTGENAGIKVTVNFTANTAVFGYGIMFGDLKGNAITQLYALGFGTIDHKIYGDWDWQGNYKPAADLGVEATEENGVLTLFYSYETLANYGLEITAESKEIKLQLFEYVTDASGNLYGCYNCMNVNGEPFAFDQGLGKFVSWELPADEENTETPETPETPNEPVIYEYQDLGEHLIDVKLEKSGKGITVTYVASETSNLFGYGICLDLPDGATDLSILFATTGNIAKMTYGNWLWTYELPTTHNIVASRTTENGVTTATMFLSYEMLGISAQTQSIGVCLFEVVNAGGSQYSIYNCMQNNGAEIIIDGGVEGFVKWDLN